MIFRFTKNAAAPVLRCFELTAAPRDPVLTDSRWVVADIRDGEPSNIRPSVFRSYGEAVTYIEACMELYKAAK